MNGSLIDVFRTSDSERNQATRRANWAERGNVKHSANLPAETPFVQTSPLRCYQGRRLIPIDPSDQPDSRYNLLSVRRYCATNVLNQFMNPTCARGEKRIRCTGWGSCIAGDQNNFGLFESPSCGMILFAMTPANLLGALGPAQPRSGQRYVLTCIQYAEKCRVGLRKACCLAARSSAATTSVDVNHPVLNSTANDRGPEEHLTTTDVPSSSVRIGRSGQGGVIRRVIISPSSICCSG